MGIINATPDSFWEGSRRRGVDAVLAQGEAMQAAGADILDLGGESTRPGSDPVEPNEELGRVAVLIEALTSRLDIPVSIDTRRASVAKGAVEAGASIINDVSALRDPEMGALAAESGVLLILMHMAGEPKTMQHNPQYHDVVSDVRDFLMQRVAFARECGVRQGSIWIDPGIGFGKTASHNMALIRGLRELVDTGYPVLMALSRKRLIGDITGRPVEERLVGTALANLLALQQGASVLRVHDVEAAMDTVALFCSSAYS